MFWKNIRVSQNQHETGELGLGSDSFLSSRPVSPTTRFLKVILGSLPPLYRQTSLLLWLSTVLNIIKDPQQGLCDLRQVKYVTCSNFPFPTSHSPPNPLQSGSCLLHQHPFMPTCSLNARLEFPNWLAKAQNTSAD